MRVVLILLVLAVAVTGCFGSSSTPPAPAAPTAGQAPQSPASGVGQAPTAPDTRATTAPPAGQAPQSPAGAVGQAATAPDTRATAAPAAGQTPATMRIALIPVADVLPLYVAEQKGYFKEASLDVQLVPVASAAERDQVMQGGQVDGALTDVINVVLFNAEQPRLKIVRKARVAFPNAPLFRLLAAKDSGVNSLQDLKGVEIGISDNSVIAYWTDRVLQREGLAKSDIKTVAIPNIVQRAQLMAQNQLKASVLPDPLASVAMLQGARVIADDTKYPELGQSVLVFREPYLRQNADAMRRFVQAYDRAVTELRTNGAAYRSLLIDKGRVPDQLKESFPIPQFPEPSVTSEAEFKDISDWAVEKGIIKAPVNYAASVDTSFVK